MRLHTLLPVYLFTILFNINSALAADGTAGPTSSAQVNISIIILPRVQTAYNTKTESLSIHPVGQTFDVVVYDNNRKIESTTINDKSSIQLSKLIKKHRKKCKKNNSKFLTNNVLLFMVIASSK